MINKLALSIFQAICERGIVIGLVDRQLIYYFDVLLRETLYDWLQANFE